MEEIKARYQLKLDNSPNTVKSAGMDPAMNFMSPLQRAQFIMSQQEEEKKIDSVGPTVGLSPPVSRKLLSTNFSQGSRHSMLSRRLSDFKQRLSMKHENGTDESSRKEDLTETPILENDDSECSDSNDQTDD